MEALLKSHLQAVVARVPARFQNVDIGELLHGLARDPGGIASVETQVGKAVAALCARFPIYPETGRA